MKCPGCKFVCSDTKDICPKCHLDLRTHKKGLGLRISNPQASYSQLLTEIGKSTGKAAAPKDKKPSAMAAAAKFFSAKPGIQEDLPTTADAPIQAVNPPLTQPKSETLQPTGPVPAVPVDPLKVNQLTEKNPKADDSSQPAPATHRVWDISENPEDLDQILNEIVGVAKIEPAPALVKPAFPKIGDEGTPDSLSAAPQNPASVESAPGADHISTADSSEGDALAEQAAEDPDTDRDQKETSCLEALSPAVQGEALVCDAPPVTTETVDAPAESQASVPVTTPVTAAQNGVGMAFELAWQELAEQAGSNGFEISAELMQPGAAKEEVTLLFELAAEAIKNPAAEQNFDEKAVFSTERRLQAGSLEKELKRVEAIISAPRVSLKHAKAREKLFAKKAASPAADAQHVDLARQAPSPAMRRLSFLIDLAHICGWALALGAGYVYCFEPEFNSTLIHPSTWDTLDKVILAGIFLAALPIAGILYPFYRLCIYTQTSGEARLLLQSVRPDGTPPGIQDLAIRGLCCPLAFCLGGEIPAQFGKMSLLDRLTGTVLVKKNPTGEDVI